MKKYLLSLMALCCSAVLFAQEKGEMYLGGTLDLSVGTQKTILSSGSISESADNPMTTSFGLGVEYAYFAAKNFRLALSVSYGMSSQPTDKVGNKWYRTNTNLFSINPNIAYYVKIVDKFYYTPEIGVSFGFGNIKSPLTETSTYTSPYSTWDIYANLIAFEYRVSPHFAMGCGYGYMGYGSAKVTDADNKNNNIKNNTFKFDLGTAGIYARYYF